MNSLTSSYVGIDSCAPLLVTAIPEAAFANCIASFSLKPLSSPYTNAPLKQSPAATVSRAFTL